MRVFASLCRMGGGAVIYFTMRSVGATGNQALAMVAGVGLVTLGFALLTEDGD